MFSRSSKQKAHFAWSNLAPHGLFDLHTHVLPMVDDGARDWDEAVQMLDGLAELGYVKIAATPHFDNLRLEPSAAAQTNMISKINEKRNHCAPEIFPAAEIVFDNLFFAQEEKGGFPHLGPQRTYLVEFGPFPGSVPAGIEKAAFQVIARGVSLILAHPERCPDLIEKPRYLDLIRRSGVLFQVDIMSFAGRYGLGPQRQALSMLGRGEIDFASSDLHSASDLPYLRRALDELARVDKAEFARLVSDNPRLVLEGMPPKIHRHD
jgi:protein-tyrosine phosphatase